MSDRSAVIFCYDGSFNGLMCCLHRCYYGRVFPEDIVTEEQVQLMLGSYESIFTDEKTAGQVISSAENRLGADFMRIVRRSFLSCERDKDIVILRFMVLGFSKGRSVLNMLANDTVNRIYKMESFVGKEAHLYTGFVRFSDCGGVLVSEIEPKNTVLPVMAKHFCDRFRSERFFIYDRTHKMALVHDLEKADIIDIDDFKMPPPSKDELFYRNMWRRFYDTIGIKERYNPRCRMNLCPKRYWNCMTEFVRDDAPAEAIGGNDDNLLLK